MQIGRDNLPFFFLLSHQGINRVLAVITKIYGGIQVMEIWKDVEGYEGQYQVSNKGRVKSLSRVASDGRRVAERILKPHNNGRGYLIVILCKDGKHINHRVHRLVANAFIDNPQNLPEVNHINENKEDNCVDNLEWCDRSYNINYGTRTLRTNKPVIGVSKDKKNYLYFNSIMDAERLGGFDQGHISECCRGKRKTEGGYTWMYAEE